ncbi:pseudouridine synthase [Xanthobacter tagetidis]|uniref:pseudouridine synthase n=1 Tax=Xanthobacter tagetidis TaxID=60216 RepID=UPI00181D83A2|nr:pseudouridine synthase [Xanthobacter tagetidis]MBB6308797.1 23S rRNA pseudouridine2605 synthase [Xanthobacter tagetidis]
MPRDKRALPAAPQKDAERVAKVIARAGLGSRREIEDWITEGRVAVNGTVLESPAFTVTAADAIMVDGAPLPERERTRLFLYHKPRGVVTTNRDPEGRTTLFEILPQGLPRLVSVGRLDLNSEGLLLLTNDGGLARVLELPETGWLRRYRVRANGSVDQAQLDALIKGITVDGVEYGPIEATLDRAQGANAWLTVALREGKNREVRNVLGALGLTVGRLIRVSYGPFQLGDIAEGGIEEVKTRILRDQIGAEIAAASGADFAGPMVEREIEQVPVRPLRPAGKRQAEREEQTGAARRPGRVRQERAVDDAPAPRGRDRKRREERELESVGTVADRKGRTVTVERVVKTEAPARPARGGKSDGARRGRPGGKDGGRDFDRPEGRFGEKPRRAGPGRFAREEGTEGRREGPRGRPSRSDEREARPDFRKGGARSGERPRSGERGEFGERPARGFADRPPRARREDAGGERPQRSYQDRPPRARREDAGGDRPPRAPRSGDGDHRIGRAPGGPRRDDFAGDRAERPSRPPRPRGEEERGGARPQRSYQDRPPRARRDDDAGARPPRGERPSYGDRPPRREGAPGAGPRGPGRGFAERSDGREDGRPPRRSVGGGFRSEGGREGGRSERPRSEGFAGERPRGAGPKGPGAKGPGSRGPGGKGAGPKGFKGGRPSGGPKSGPKSGPRSGPRGKS